MSRHHPLDDAAIDEFFDGRGAPEGLAPLLGLVEDLQRMTSGAAPTPSAELAPILADGFSSPGQVVATSASPRPGLGRTRQAAGGSWTRRRKRRLAEFLGGLGVAGKAVLGAGAAAAAVTAGGAADVLPGPVQHVVSTSVAAVTPFSLPDKNKAHPNPARPVAPVTGDRGAGTTASTLSASNGGPITPAGQAQKGSNPANPAPSPGGTPTSVKSAKPTDPASDAPGRSGTVPGAAHTSTSDPSNPSATAPASGHGSSNATKGRSSHPPP